MCGRQPNRWMTRVMGYKKVLTNNKKLCVKVLVKAMRTSSNEKNRENFFCWGWIYAENVIYMTRNLGMHKRRRWIILCIFSPSMFFLGGRGMGIKVIYSIFCRGANVTSFLTKKKVSKIPSYHKKWIILIPKNTFVEWRTPTPREQLNESETLYRPIKF